MHENRAFVIIVNPTSGKGRALRVAESVAGQLRSQGASVTIAQTEKGGDAERLATEAIDDPTRRPNCVVGCGGDGTLQEVANALANRRSALGEQCPTMGILPAGRCNDFARALRVPRSIEGMMRVLCDGQPRPIDLGCVNGRFFCTVATAGADAEVSSYVDTMRMPLRGTIAYLYGAVRVLAYYKPKEVRLTGSFGTIQRRVFLATSANTSSYGGAIPIAPDAVPTDGQLDICIIGALSTIGALAIIPTVLRGRHNRRADVQFLKTDKLSMTSDEPMDLWADGERIGNTPATIEVVPRAINVLLPS